MPTKSLKNILPPSGTPHILQFKIKGIKPFPIINLDFQKDIDTPINGGKLTTPLNTELYKKLKINQTFELWLGWKNNKNIQIMTGYISNIQTGNNNIELEFTDKGALLRKTCKINYKKWNRLHIIKDAINHSGLRPEIDYSHETGDKIDYDTGSKDIKGKTYENILQELTDGSTQDLISIIEDNTCKIVNLSHLPTKPSTDRLPLYEGFNILKDSITISKTASNTINKITVYFKDDTRKYHVTVSEDNYGYIGEKHDIIEETWIKTAPHAKDYGHKLLKKNRRERFQIDLSTIANPQYNILTPCHVKIPKYNIDHNLIISRLNLKASADKTPLMDLCLVSTTNQETIK